MLLMVIHTLRRKPIVDVIRFLHAESTVFLQVLASRHSPNATRAAASCIESRWHA